MIRPKFWQHLVLLIFVMRSATAGVIGEDDRRAPAADEAQLLRALGQVVCTKFIGGDRRRSASTGTLVGNRSTVLTVAHAFSDRLRADELATSEQILFDAVQDCVFRQLDAAGSIISEARFRSVEMGSYRNNPGMPNDDWAVLRLEDALPESVAALPFAESVSDLDELSGLAIRILAYHTDVPAARRIPLLSEGRLLNVEYGGFRRLAHTADIGRMSSGAAIVHRTHSGDYIVVGVNRSSANHGEFNLAVPLSAELEIVLKNHAWENGPAPNAHVAMLSGGRAARTPQ